jgi:hypothetical protein
MMHFHKFKIGAHIVMSPPRGQVTGFRVIVDPHTNQPTTFYDIVTAHGPIEYIPEHQLHFYEPGLKVAPEPMANDPLLPARGDIEHAETLGGVERDNVEPMFPSASDDDVVQTVDEVKSGLLGALGVQEVMGTYRAAQDPVPGDSAYAGEERRIEQREPFLGRRQVDRDTL